MLRITRASTSTSILASIPVGKSQIPDPGSRIRIRIPDPDPDPRPDPIRVIYFHSSLRRPCEVAKR